MASAAQVAALGTDVVQALSTAAVAALTPAEISAQIGLFTPTQIAAISTDGLSGVDSRGRPPAYGLLIASVRHDAAALWRCVMLSACLPSSSPAPQNAVAARIKTPRACTPATSGLDQSIVPRASRLSVLYTPPFDICCSCGSMRPVIMHANAMTSSQASILQLRRRIYSRSSATTFSKGD